MRVVALVGLLAGCDGVFGLIEIRTNEDALDTAGLVAHYRLDETSGTMYADSSGLGHIATCVDPRCPDAVPGHVSGAARFDGTDDRVDVAGGVDFDGSAAFTVALWMNAEQLAGCPASKVSGTAGDNSWQLCLTSTGLLMFWANSPDGIPLAARAPISTNSWHHVAMRWDGRARVLSIDGVDATELATTMITFDGGPILIGADADMGVTLDPFRGLIDEVRIYSRALSTAEITMLAQQ